jgi:hypothetical protein
MSEEKGVYSVPLRLKGPLQHMAERDLEHRLRGILEQPLTCLELDDDGWRLVERDDASPRWDKTLARGATLSELIDNAKDL